MHYDGPEYSTVSEKVITPLLLVSVLGEKAIKVANRFWTSVFWTLGAAITCVVLMVHCNNMSVPFSSPHWYFYYCMTPVFLVAASVLGIAFVWNLGIRDCSVTETS